MYKLGVDIGGTKINIGILSRENEVLFSKKVSISSLQQGEFFHAVAAEIQTALREAELTTEDCEFCGVGVPGTVDATGRIAVKLPNLHLYDAPAADVLEACLKIPVRLVQDSRAAAWAEYLAGNGRGYRHVVCVTLGTGIGLGMVLDGKIFDGATGTAGEIGHNCVVAGGRACSCGQSGCLGMYSAGLGLQQTARELLGADAAPADLFAAAEAGNTAAQERLREAVFYLGRELVALYNVTAPDCMLFSGGISRRNAWYVQPLIDYIQAHIYRTEGGKMPLIGLAALGEDAPMIGAALLPHSRKLESRFSASLMCADILHLEQDLVQLKEAGIGMLHMDVMDGHFVPNLMLPVDYINRVRRYSDAVFDVHIMAENPERIVDALQLSPGDIVCVHHETTRHLQRMLAKIRAKGLRSAVALNPATPLSSIEEVLCDLDMILVMTVNPGFAGQALVPQTLDKVRRLRSWLDAAGYADIEIEVDGNCSFENIPRMQRAGANIFVLGTSALFRKDMSIKEAVDTIERHMEAGC